MQPFTPQRHHYIPQFYLKHWRNDDGRLCEYSKQNGIIKPRRVAPNGTAYERNLYTDASLPEPLRVAIEEKFFKALDQKAYDLFEAIQKPGPISLAIDKRHMWAQFMLSLAQRHPEKVTWLRQNWPRLLEESLDEIEKDYEQKRSADWPITFSEFRDHVLDSSVEQSAILTLPSIINLPRCCSFIANMDWRVYSFENPAHTLLTSDRPVIMSNGLAGSDGHIALPLSPKHLFIGIGNKSAEAAIKAMTPKVLLTAANDRVAGQACRYVYGIDDTQLRFVENRLGKRDPQFIGKTNSIHLQQINQRLIPPQIKPPPAQIY